MERAKRNVEQLENKHLNFFLLKRKKEEKKHSTLLEGLQLLIGQTQLLVLVLQRAVLPAELGLLQSLDFGLLLQLHHLVHQEMGQAFVALFH